MKGGKQMEESAYCPPSEKMFKLDNLRLSFLNKQGIVNVKRSLRASVWIGVDVHFIATHSSYNM
ncbi:Phosphoribosylamine--glycine ligase, partial [Clarias magur]